MASSICNRLIQKVWRSFIDDRGKIPQAEGIYTIGLRKTDGNVEYLYVRYSKDMHRRVPEHERQNLDIDEFIKKQIEKNGGRNLRVKWVEDPDGKCKEGEYIECMTKKLGKKPPLNKKGGNNCP